MEVLVRTLAGELRAQRARQGISVKEICQQTNLSTSTILRTLRGDRICNISELERIAKAINTTGSDLLRRAEQQANQ